MEYGKLIELLNEYQQDFRYQDESDVDYREARIISKSYGFIERLVKNNKIDFKSENYLLKSYDGYFDDDILCMVKQDCNTYEDRIKVEFNKIDSLIMILSIQDNPIEYLCSILKE